MVTALVNLNEADLVTSYTFNMKKQFQSLFMILNKIFFLL